MASTFILGRGSSLSISVDGTTFVPVKQIQQANYSGGKLDLDDISNLDSPSSFKEYAPTQADAGQVQLSGVFTDADPGQLMFNAAFTAATLLSVQMQMAPRKGQTKGFLRTFTAYVTEPANLSYSTTKVASFQATMKITGPFTDVAGS